MRAPAASPHASTWSLVLVALCFGLGQNVVKPIIAPQAVALGGDAVTAGIVVAAQGLGGLLTAIPTGNLLGRLGGRVIVGAGAAVFTLGAALMVVAADPVPLAVGHFLLGAGGVGAWLAAQTLATIATSDAASRRKIARVSTAALAGMLGGPPIGGLLTDYVGVTAAFAASLVAGVLLLPLALFLPRGTRADLAATPAKRLPDGGRAARLFATHLWRRHGVLAALVTSSTAQALLTIRQSFLPLHLEGGGWSSTQIGTVLSLAGVGALAARSAFAVLDQRFRASTLMTMCTVPGAVALGTSASSYTGVVVVVSVLVSGFALGLSQPLTLLMLARVTSESERGMAVGQRVAGNRLTQAVVPAIFGLLAGWLGLLAGFWVIVVACIAGDFAARLRRTAT
ncbi:MFS transporter [Jiangella asiatica]|uniref:MFS transporter n=1 Tax=Jiangella asiatica TaxID=2530372 RepID=A0A4V2Z242_9ACTN|nr:MFS transporter [Jiangella asiatica]TDE07458.1 MFS transporter [Jiangella asiatica]